MRRETGFIDDEDPFGLHLAEQSAVGLRKPGLCPFGLPAHLGEQVGGRVSAEQLPGALPARAVQPDEVGDAHLEEFVLVVRYDAEELQPGEQRYAAVLRLLQDPFIEREPAQFAVVVGIFHGLCLGEELQEAGFGRIDPAAESRVGCIRPGEVTDETVEVEAPGDDPGPGRCRVGSIDALLDVGRHQ